MVAGRSAPVPAGRTALAVAAVGCLVGATKVRTPPLVLTLTLTLTLNLTLTLTLTLTLALTLPRGEARAVRSGAGRGGTCGGPGAEWLALPAQHLAHQVKIKEEIKPWP